MARISPNQLTLDFTSRRNEMLARVRSMQPGLQTIVPPQSAEQVIELLVRVVLFGDADGISHARNATLGAGFADRRSVGERTIRRWAAMAKELGLLSVRERSHETGGSQTNRWEINWARVRELVITSVPSREQRSHAEDCEGVPSPPQKAADTGRSPGGQDVRPRAVIMSAPMYFTPNSITHSPHPQSALAQPNRSDAWDGVGGELGKLGMTLWPRFVAEAQRANVSPAEVADWIQEFRAAKLDGPGAFFFRLRNGGWPGGVKVASAAEIAQKRNQATQDAAAAQVAAEAKLAADNAARAKQAAFEAEFGPMVDRLTREEHRQLCLRAFESNRFMLTRSSKQPTCQLVREQLMEFLSKEGVYAGK